MWPVKTVSAFISNVSSGTLSLHRSVNAEMQCVSLQLLYAITRKCGNQDVLPLIAAGSGRLQTLDILNRNTQAQQQHDTSN